MKINLVINFLGHNFYVGFGVGMDEEAAPSQPADKQHVVLTTDRSRPTLGFRPNDDDDEEDSEDDND